MTDTARDTAMPAEIASLVERLRIPWPPNGSGDEVTLPVWAFELMNEAATAFEAQAAELAAMKVSNNKWLAKWERAEARVAELEKALKSLDRMNRGLDWCDLDEQARRWSAARRALTGGKKNG